MLAFSFGMGRHPRAAECDHRMIRRPTFSRRPSLFAQRSPANLVNGSASGRTSHRLPKASVGNRS